MSERNPFDKQYGGREQRPAGRPLRCEEWEALLADALDGLLPATDGAAFHAHSAECPTCAQLLAEAKQGQEWMQFLHVEPEMPGDLVEKILERTSGTAAGGPLTVAGAPAPVAAGVLRLPVRRVWDNRLMMTAAMAFFSIALTLNLTGIRLTGLRLSDMTPANIYSSLNRQVYGARKQVVQYYDNLRFVLEVESKIREMRRDDAPAQQKPAGSSSSDSPKTSPKNGGSSENAPQQDILWGRPTLACERMPRICHRRKGKIQQTKIQQTKILVAHERDQAERSLA
jgi:hypothetical protein